MFKGSHLAALLIRVASFLCCCDTLQTTAVMWARFFRLSLACKTASTPKIAKLQRNLKLNCMLAKHTDIYFSKYITMPKSRVSFAHHRGLPAGTQMFWIQNSSLQLWNAMNLQKCLEQIAKACVHFDGNFEPWLSTLERCNLVNGHTTWHHISPWDIEWRRRTDLAIWRKGAKIYK